MRTKLVLIAAVLLAALSGCQKDLATVWKGTYTGTAGSTFSQVVITKLNNNTLKVELKSPLGTYATIANGKLNSPNVLTINEDGSINGYSGTWHISGTGTLSYNTLSLNGVATQSGQSDINYVFSGSK